MSKIKNIVAYEILDSRGIPTVKVKIESDSGMVEYASVPSGSSAGKFEAHELRDGGKRHKGKGVKKAVANINKVLKPKLIGKDPSKQKEIDELMIKLDGTLNKKKLGANAILAVSVACAKIAAKNSSESLYEYLNKTFFRGIEINIPTPFSVVIEAGAHSKSNLEVQEFMIVPEDFIPFSKKIEIMTDIFYALGEDLVRKGHNANIGLEGAYGPKLSSNSEAMDTISEIIKEKGFNGKVKIALDIAASEFYSGKNNGSYNLKSAGVNLTERQLLGLYEEWISKYPIVSIEDGLEENDWTGWAEMNKRFSGRIKIIGDDLSATNPKRVARGIKGKAFTGCIVKPNQIGTVSETAEVINMLKKNKLDYIISHRGGDTEDTFIADLAVASGAMYIKTGAPSRGERVAKYNRLLEIEQELGS